jgi:hypothetical protein
VALKVAETGGSITGQPAELLNLSAIWRNSMLRVTIAINDTPVNTLFVVNDGSGDLDIGNYSVFGRDKKAPMFRVEGHLREKGPTVLASRVLRDYLDLYGAEESRRDCLTCKHEPRWMGITQGGVTNNASGVCKMTYIDRVVPDLETMLLHMMPHPGREYCNLWEPKAVSNAV